MKYVESEKLLTSSVISGAISFFVTRKFKKIKKLMKIASIDRENLHMFWTTWGIPVKFSKDLTCDTIKSHKKSGFGDTCLEKQSIVIYLILSGNLNNLHHFRPIFHFIPTENSWNLFSGGIKWKHWTIMCWRERKYFHIWWV